MPPSNVGGGIKINSGTFIVLLSPDFKYTETETHFQNEVAFLMNILPIIYNFINFLIATFHFFPNFKMRWVHN